MVVKCPACASLVAGTHCPVCQTAIPLTVEPQPGTPSLRRYGLALRPQKTIRFHDDVDRQLAHRLEALARLEGTRINDVILRLLHLGLQHERRLSKARAATNLPPTYPAASPTEVKSCPTTPDA